MNLFNNIVKFFKNNVVEIMTLVFLLAVSSTTSVASSLFFSEKASVSETVANRINYLSRNDPYKRSNIIIEDNSGLLYINNYHIKMMSYMGKNNSIFCKYNEPLEATPLNSEKKALNISAYGITNCGNGYVYGQTLKPYDVEIINGSYSPNSVLYDDTVNSNARGCIISESLAYQLFGSEDPISKKIAFSLGEQQITFAITAVAKNAILCNNYEGNSNFVMTNFMFLKQLFGGHCSLTFRLRNEYYTNLSIFQRFFSKLYIKGYSAERLSINFGDEQLNSYIRRTIIDEYSPSKLIYLGYTQVPLQVLIGFLLSLLMKKQKWKTPSSFYILIPLLYLLFSFTFADILNGIHIGIGFYNSKASITTVFLITNAIVLLLAFLESLHLFENRSSIKNKINRNYKIDI